MRSVGFEVVNKHASAWHTTLCVDVGVVLMELALQRIENRVAAVSWRCSDTVTLKISDELDVRDEEHSNDSR